MTKTSQFRAEVKENGQNGACSVLLNNHDDIGQGVGPGRKQVTLWLPEGTDIKDAEKLAAILNGQRLKVSVA